MIERIAFGYMLVKDLISFCRDILEGVTPLSDETLPINKSITKLNERFQVALKASNSARSSKYTKLLMEKDRLRDRSFLGFRFAVEAYTYSNDEVKAIKAESICSIIRDHDWSLHSKGRKHESGLLASLIQKLNEPANKQKLVDLGLETWFNSLVADADAFNALVQEKEDAEKDQAKEDHMDIYKQLREACDQYFDDLEAINRLDPNEKYEQMIEKVNGFSKSYMTDLRARQTKKENEELEEEEI